MARPYSKNIEVLHNATVAREARTAKAKTQQLKVIQTDHQKEIRTKVRTDVPPAVKKVARMVANDDDVQEVVIRIGYWLPNSVFRFTHYNKAEDSKLAMQQDIAVFMQEVEKMKQRYQGYEIIVEYPSELSTTPNGITVRKKPTPATP